MNKKITEIFDPHLKVSKYQWGEIEGVNKMKSMTPGQKVTKPKKMAENKIPYLFMTDVQKQRLNEENMQLEFDGIQTKNLDMCPGAYKEFKSMIAQIRAGKHIGEITGHQAETPTSPTSDTLRKVQAGIAMKPATLKHMQFKQYTGL